MAEAEHLSVFSKSTSTEKGRMDAPAPGGLAKDKPSGSTREGISGAAGKHLQTRVPCPPPPPGALRWAVHRILGLPSLGWDWEILTVVRILQVTEGKGFFWKTFCP